MISDTPFPITKDSIIFVTGKEYDLLLNRVYFMIYRVLFAILCVLITYLPNNTHNLAASHDSEDLSYARLYDKYSTPWVDSVFHSLSMEERIAQLFMIRVHTDDEIDLDDPISDVMMLQLILDQEKSYYDSIINLIGKYNIGGVAFFSGNPYRQVKMTNKLQQKASIPLFVAMDAEWGLGMRLENTISFPYQLTLGALQDEKLIYEMGIEIARQLRRIGVNINFAPVVDVNSNPLNPVINFRSFGESRYNVASKSLAYMMGMQDWGIIANAKHFPGHGDTSTDSHHTLPIIDHDHELIDSLHLHPFKYLFDNGLKSVMTAHLNIPTYDKTENLAATLSKNVITGLLQNELGFDGLIFTDALDMRGVSDYFPPGELELKALKAGNDILLLPEDIPAAIDAIKKGIENGEISHHHVNNKCRKVLFYKEMTGLNNYTPVSSHKLSDEINTTKAKLLNKKLVENAITLVKNNNDLLPLKRLDTLNIASLAIGIDSINAFQDNLFNYHPIDTFSIRRNFRNQESGKLIEELSEYNLVILSLHNNSSFAGSNYGINDNIIKLIEDISKNNNTVLNLFANPYILNFFDNTETIESIIISYQDGEYYGEASAHVIFGGLPAKGKLPVSATPFFPVGTGIITPADFRVRYKSLIEAGVSADIVENVDSIVNYGIDNKAYPGAQVVVIKDGNVIINKSYGHHTYDKTRAVKNSDIYDLASLTKIAATTTAIMHLKDQGLIDVDNHFDDYLPWLKNSNLAGISIREVMAHQGRLQSWIPFHLETIEDNRINPAIYSNYHSDDYPVQVAKDLYIHKSYRDTILKRIMESPIRRQQGYRYSDLGFILLAEVVKELSGLSLDEYMSANFYQPMGMLNTTFNPLEKFDKSRIVVTENDTLFRQQQLRGFVHDQAAAMLGGVSGHAGLFSTAKDIAILMQMFLQGGYYAGHQYIKEETINKFTTVQYPGDDNRRAIGFDKPDTGKQNGPTCKSASPNSFGHLGFTGTYAWADPEEDLVYVFLSNRIQPYSSNRKLAQKNIRTDIQQAIYDAIYKTKYLESYKIP